MLTQEQTAEACRRFRNRVYQTLIVSARDGESFLPTSMELKEVERLITNMTADMSAVLSDFVDKREC